MTVTINDQKISHPCRLVTIQVNGVSYVITEAAGGNLFLKKDSNAPALNIRLEDASKIHIK